MGVIVNYIIRNLLGILVLELKDSFGIIIE